MYILNYFYFLIITGIGVKLLFQRQGIVSNPLNKKQKLFFTGPELFWTLTFSTGLFAFSVSGEIDLMAIRLGVLEIFCIIGIHIVKRKAVWSPAATIYLLYLLWLVIGLFYSPAPGYGFRIILKYLYSFLILLLASVVVRDKEVFLKAGLGARTVALISVIIAFVPYLEQTIFPGVIWYGTARAINYIVICVFSLALFFYMGKEKQNLWLAILFMLPCIIWVFRTSIMGTTLAITTFFFFRYKLKLLPIIFSIIILFVIAVFFISGVKEKMFNKEITTSQLGRKEISMDDINSNGRFAVWETLLKKFYTDKKIIGAGTGSTQNYLYSNYVFGELKVPHNDYVQILCDNGLIGIILYLLSTFLALIHSFIEYNRTKYPVVRICAITAGSSMAGVLLTMCADNVVNYSMATLSYPFGFYGMMLGLKRNKKQ
jgi:hypothetical protein